MLIEKSKQTPASWYLALVDLFIPTSQNTALKQLMNDLHHFQTDITQLGLKKKAK